jgi:hypothetical protein
MSLAESGDHPTLKRVPGSFSEWLHTWRYFFWLLGVGAIVILVYAEENWRGAWLWERYQHQLEARGERLKASALVPPIVADDENFAMTPLLAPLLGFSSGSPPWNARAFAPRYDAAELTLRPKFEPRSNSWVAARIDLVAWQTAFLKSTNATKETAVALATNSNLEIAASTVLAALSESDPFFDELRIASHRPHSRFNLDYNSSDPASILLPHLSVLKHLSQVLQLRASAELALRRTEDAANDLDLMFTLADACREEPIVISHLVRIAQLQLALQPLAEGMGQWSEPQLRAFEERLRRFDFLADARLAFEAERALFINGEIDFFRRSSDKLKIVSTFGSMTPSQAGHGSLEFAGALLTAAPSGWLYLEQVSQSRIYQDYLLPTIDLPHRRIRPDAFRQAKSRITRLEDQSPTALVFRHEFFSAVMIPSVLGLVERMAFAQTAVDTAQVACALERCRLAEGHFPNSLESLRPKFIDKLPQDVVNGQPLKYRLIGIGGQGGYLLYSVGMNETDDGGEPGANQKGGESPISEGDWVWRGGPDAL